MDSSGDGAEATALRVQLDTLRRELAHVQGELEELRDREALYRELVELAPDAMLVHGADRRIVYMNPAGARMFGVETPDHILGAISTEFIHPDSRQSAELELDRVIAGEIASSIGPEKHMMRLEGGEFFADVTATSIEWDDAPA